MTDNRDGYELINSFQFSENEQNQFFAKLWELLRWQAKKYNGIDSSSMPVGKAQDLTASLMYILSVASRTEGIDTKALLQRDFEEMVKRGQDILDRKRRIVYTMWKKMCMDSPQIQNGYYVDTVRELGAFFKRYDIYYDAHQIPCSIDYPLLAPIGDDVFGISFIEEYIRRLMLENQFINSFEAGEVIKCLSDIIPNYKKDYVNLCESIFTNALLRDVLGHSPDKLSLTEEDVALLKAELKGKARSELACILTNALIHICQVKHFDVSKADYFDEAIMSLAIRLENLEDGAFVIWRGRKS